MLEGPRAVRPDELPAVIRLADTVFSVYGPHDMGRWFPTLFSPGNAHRLRVFADSGRPVSLVGVTVNRVHAGGLGFPVGCVGAVCTLREYQGQGLATRLMEDALRLCSEEKVAVLLISGGRGLYRRLGCIDAGLYQTARVEPDARLPELRSEVRQWCEKDVPCLAMLHGREPVRFERGPDEFLAFLRAGRVTNHPGRTWVVGSPVSAWLCVEGPRDEPEGRVATIAELGGSRTAALAALPRIFEEHKASRIDIAFPASDIELRSLLALSGIPVVARGFDGTVRVFDADSAARLAAERTRLLVPEPRRSSLQIAAEGSALCLRMGAEEHRAEGLAEMTALLFGSREREARMPAPGPLRAAMETIFPIPLVDYGLNYI